MNALERCVACVETECRIRRLVKDLVFTDLKLIWYNGRGHLIPLRY
jgi:hypothetical protein